MSRVSSCGQTPRRPRMVGPSVAGSSPRMRSSPPRDRRDRGDHPHRRGLAGAVRAEEPERLAAAYGHVDPAHGLEVAEGLPQPARPDHRVVMGRRIGTPVTLEDDADQRTRPRHVLRRGVGPGALRTHRLRRRGAGVVDVDQPHGEAVSVGMSVDTAGGRRLEAGQRGIRRGAGLTYSRPCRPVPSGGHAVPLHAGSASPTGPAVARRRTARRSRSGSRGAGRGNGTSAGSCSAGPRRRH